jgi:hypothetical protein
MTPNDPSVHQHSGVSPSLFERPENVRRLIRGLVVTCVLLVLADFFYTNPHPHFEPLETSLGFQAWFGFLAFAVVVFLGKLLRLVIMRDEDYYESMASTKSADVAAANDSSSGKKSRKRSKKGKRG